MRISGILRLPVFFVVAACLSGCLTTKSYIDPALPVLAKSDLPTVRQPRPVSVLFEFRTKNNANARATSALQGRVISAVAQSGVFGQVSSTMGPAGSGLLKVIIDNEADTGDAVAKGFATGLTLGLAGSVVTDNYICTASYSYSGRSVETTVRHSLHSTVGAHSALPGMAPMQTADAINQVVDQLVWHALKQLDAQKAFAP